MLVKPRITAPTLTKIGLLCEEFFHAMTSLDQGYVVFVLHVCHLLVLLASDFRFFFKLLIIIFGLRRVLPSHREHRSVRSINNRTLGPT